MKIIEKKGSAAEKTWHMKKKEMVLHL